MLWLFKVSVYTRRRIFLFFKRFVMKRKVMALLIALLLAIGVFTGCAAQEDRSELIVFAAASMTETLTQLGEKYMAENEGVEVIFTFDSSGTLKTQIEQGAECDIFISAGKKQIDQLDITASAEVNTDGLDFVLEGSRFDILENKVALIVPESNPLGLSSYEDLKTALAANDAMLAIGNADVPVGQYTQKIFAYFGLDEESLANAGCITYGPNVKDITSKVSEAVVDCGIVYQTDAFSAGLTVADTATAEMCGQVIYPAAIMKESANREAAEAFLEYLTSDEADKIFESVGFSPIG